MPLIGLRNILGEVRTGGLMPLEELRWPAELVPPGMIPDPRDDTPVSDPRDDSIDVDPREQ